MSDRQRRRLSIVAAVTREWELAHLDDEVTPVHPADAESAVLANPSSDAEADLHRRVTEALRAEGLEHHDPPVNEASS